MANDPPVNTPLKMVLLQETHFPKRFCPSFIHSKFPFFTLANAEDKIKGVGIFIFKRCKFTLKSELRDPDGRYILIVGELDNQLYSLISLISLIVLCPQQRPTSLLSTPVQNTNTTVGGHSDLWGRF